MLRGCFVVKLGVIMGEKSPESYRWTTPKGTLGHNCSFYILSSGGAAITILTMLVARPICVQWGRGLSWEVVNDANQSNKISSIYIYFDIFHVF